MRDEFSDLAVDFFSGKDRQPAKLEMTPSKDCVEGDMLLTEEQKEVYFMMREATAKNRARVRREAENAFRKWPDATLVYRFHRRLSEFALPSRDFIKERIHDFPKGRGAWTKKGGA